MAKRFSFDGPPKLRLLCGAAIAILLGFVAIASYTIVDAWRATWTNAIQSSTNLATTLAHDIDRNITLYDLSLQTAVAGLKLKQILAFSRKETVDKKPMDLGAVTRDALQMMRAGLPAMIALVEHIEETPPVLGDAGQIRQVIINLLTNAAQAIGDKTGTINVRISGAGEKVRLSVADTGCGIDQKHLPRLFDPFFTTKEAGQGTGLGLSVVHGIVAAHNGRIDVESAPGQGAKFVVSLPAIAAQQSPATIETAA